MPEASQTDTLALASTSKDYDAKEWATQDPFCNEWPLCLQQHPVVMVMVVQAEGRSSRRSDVLFRVPELKTARGI